MVINQQFKAFQHESALVLSINFFLSCVKKTQFPFQALTGQARSNQLYQTRQAKIPSKQKRCGLQRDLHLPDMMLLVVCTSLPSRIILKQFQHLECKNPSVCKLFFSFFFLLQNPGCEKVILVGKIRETEACLIPCYLSKQDPCRI